MSFLPEFPSESHPSDFGGVHERLRLLGRVGGVWQLRDLRVCHRLVHAASLLVGGGGRQAAAAVGGGLDDLG